MCRRPWGALKAAGAALASGTAGSRAGNDTIWIGFLCLPVSQPLSLAVDALLASHLLSIKVSGIEPASAFPAKVSVHLAARP